MTRYFLICLGLLSGVVLQAQPDTDIYLVSLEKSGDSLIFGAPENITQNPGYDNQPSFVSNEVLLFSSTRNGQTDIRRYNLKTGEDQWISNTAVGSEYSPQQIPGSEDISAIRLDTTGLQRLYRYTPKGNAKKILEKAKVGYQLWLEKNLLMTTVLVENRMDLQLHFLKEGHSRTYQKNVGRSLLKIPGTDRVSYVNRENGISELKSMHPLSGATEVLLEAGQIQDFCWLPDGTLIAGEGNSLLAYQVQKDSSWQLIKSFNTPGLGSISRIALSPDGKTLALVSNVSPESIVQRQVESYNAKNLDRFVRCFSEDVWAGRFPRDTFYVGRETMRRNYEDYLSRVSSSTVEVVSRIVLGNTVIDKELANEEGKLHEQVAIYKIANGTIESMNFIFDSPGNDPEAIVQQQLDAYNARDIDAFVSTYTKDVELCNYPDISISRGREQLREAYAGFFTATPDLKAEISKRIIIANKVIDLEKVRVNGNEFNAIAIYEVAEGKIAKVTFIR
jgi:hypothetical protein